jgi:hypothetical protein
VSGTRRVGQIHHYFSGQFSSFPSNVIDHIDPFQSRICPCSLPLFKAWTEFLEEVSGQPDLFFEPSTALSHDLKLEGLVVPIIPAAAPDAPVSLLQSCENIWKHACHEYEASSTCQDMQTFLKNLADPEHQQRLADTSSVPEVDEVGMGTQLYWLIDRQIKFLRGSPAMTWGRLIPSVVFSVIVGSLFYQIGNSQADARTRVGAIFFAIANTAFAAFAMVNQVFGFRPVFYIQKRGSYFRPALHPIAFMLTDVRQSCCYRLFVCRFLLSRRLCVACCLVVVVVVVSVIVSVVVGGIVSVIFNYLCVCECLSCPAHFPHIFLHQERRDLSNV